MKFTLRDLVLSRDAIDDLTSVQLPGKIAYELAKFKKAVEPYTTSFDEARINLLTPYANEDNSVSIPADKIPEVNDELEKLLKEEIEVAYEPVSIERLIKYWDAKDIAITVDSLVTASFLFSDF